MPVHWPCLLLMGCLHWLGKWWLDGQVTLLGMMEHLSFLFVLSFALLFILSCQDAVQSFLEYVNSRGFVLFFSGLLVQFLVPIFQWHWSAVKFALKSMAVTSLSPSKALTLWWLNQPRFGLHFKYIILFLIAVSRRQRKHTALSPKCDW